LIVFIGEGYAHGDGPRLRSWAVGTETDCGHGDGLWSWSLFEHLIIEEFRYAHTQPLTDLLNHVYRGFAAIRIQKAIHSGWGEPGAFSKLDRAHGALCEQGGNTGNDGFFDSLMKRSCGYLFHRIWKEPIRPKKHLQLKRFSVIIPLETLYMVIL